MYVSLVGAPNQVWALNCDLHSSSGKIPSFQETQRTGCHQPQQEAFPVGECGYKTSSGWFIGVLETKQVYPTRLSPSPAFARACPKVQQPEAVCSDG